MLLNEEMSATYQEIKRAVEIIAVKSQEGANYNVYEASNGEKGIEVYKKLGNIDLIITDIYMLKKVGSNL